MIHTVLSSATSCAGMRIGLLGGSFNPAHEGHLTTSLYALRKLRLDEIWWLVSPQNPLKSKTGMKAFTERVRLARAMAKNNPRIRVTDFEARSGTRYTVDTIRALRRQMPGAHFVWLMGADNFRQVSQWRNWKALFQIVPIAVFRRPGYAIRPTSDEAVQRFAYARQNMDAAGRLALMAPPAWLVLDNRLNPSSATRLRRKNA